MWDINSFLISFLKGTCGRPTDITPAYLSWSMYSTMALSPVECPDVYFGKTVIVPSSDRTVFCLSSVTAVTCDCIGIRFIRNNFFIYNA